VTQFDGKVSPYSFIFSHANEGQLPKNAISDTLRRNETYPHYYC